MQTDGSSNERADGSHECGRHSQLRPCIPRREEENLGCLGYRDSKAKEERSYLVRLVCYGRNGCSRLRRCGPRASGTQCSSKLPRILGLTSPSPGPFRQVHSGRCHRSCKEARSANGEFTKEILEIAGDPSNQLELCTTADCFQ